MKYLKYPLFIMFICLFGVCNVKVVQAYSVYNVVNGGDANYYINNKLVVDDEIKNKYVWASYETQEPIDGGSVQPSGQQGGNQEAQGSQQETAVANCGILGSPEKKLNSISDPAYYLQFIFNIMKYVAIVLLFGLTVVDLCRYVFSGKDDDIKRIGLLVVKRLIICIVIFFLPYIIKFAFRILGLYGDATCGIK